MRKILFFLAICLMTCSMFAAPPHAFRYQAIVRDLSGAIVANNSNIQVRVQIWQNFNPSIPAGPGNGIMVYEEEHTNVRSNDLGMINLSIGRGNQTSSDAFEDIDWGAGAHHVQLAFNINNTTWVNLQRAELLSVPYALFAANAGGGGGGYWQSGGGAGNPHLRNINEGSVFIGAGVSPVPFPTTDAKLHVGGNIGIGDGFYIAVSETSDDAFSIGMFNDIFNADEVFILGAYNTVIETPSVSILGTNNEVSPGGIGTNLMSVLIGNYNHINTATATDNILIGRDNVSGQPSVVGIGTGIRPSSNSVFIGQSVTAGIRPGNEYNIAMGHNITMSPLPGASAYLSRNIIIGNDIAPPGSAFFFSGDRTIAIGNDIRPHASLATVVGNPNNASHSVNIGNNIQTSSRRSINIGDNISADNEDVRRGADRTIAIGRNITFPIYAPYVPTGASNLVDNDGTIVLGTNFPERYPLSLGRVGLGGDVMANVPSGPRPRFVVGGYSTWLNHHSGFLEPIQPIHFLYIDDFANAYFGFIGNEAMQIMSTPPTEAINFPGDPISALPSGIIDGAVGGGLIFARRLIALSPTLTPSDRELKTNIVPIRDRVQPAGASLRRTPAPSTGFSEILFSEALSRINMYSYNYNFAAADPRENWGFMAQDVFPHFPHLVTTVDSETLSMSYAGFIPILWTIAQDQQVQITELQDEVSSLRNELTEIRYLLKQLMND